MNPMVAIYVDLIRKGKKTLQDVPLKIRHDVEQAAKEAGLLDAEPLE